MVLSTKGRFKDGWVIPKWRSGILCLSENTKTNEENLHGFSTDTFLKWPHAGLRGYSCNTKQENSYSIGRTLVEHVFSRKSAKSLSGKIDTFKSTTTLSSSKKFINKKGVQI